MIHDLYITGLLAAHRHHRFLADAQQQRRLAQLDRVRGRRPTTSEMVTALRTEVATWSGRYQAWCATTWRERLSMSSRA